MYKIITNSSLLKFYSGFICLISFSIYGQTSTENYTKSITYLTETPDGNVSEEEMIESIVYYDGLNRPKQSITQRAGGNKEDLVTPIFYDQFGRQSIEYLPLPVENNNGDFYIGTNGNISGEIKSYYKQKFPNDFYSPPGLHPDWDNPYTEKIFENSPVSKVLEYAAPGYDWRNTGSGDHTLKKEYATNGSNEVKKFSIEYDSQNNPNLRDDGFYSINSPQLIKTIAKSEDWVSGKLNTSETFTDKNGKVILTNSFVANGGNVETLSTYFVYDDYGRLIYKIPPKLDFDNSGPSLYDDLQKTWSIKDFISPANSSLDGNIYLEIEDDILTLNWNFTLDPYTNYATLHPETIKIINANPPLPDMYLGELTGYDGPVYNNFHVGDIYIENGNLVIRRVSSESFLALTFIPVEISLSPNSLENLAFQYKYDKRNRLIEQKTPGKGWEYIIFDNLDRPILTQDSKLRAQNKWLFTKYDILGRVLYTGIFTPHYTKLRSDLETELTSQPLYEVRTENPITIGDTNLYYSNSAYPNQNLEILTINYYDSYVDHLGISLPNTVYGVSTQVNTQGLSTVNKIRVLDTNNWIISLIGYDKEGRTIYSSSKNEYLQTIDVVKSKIDFSGKLLEAITMHSKTGNATITTQDFYSYDHSGRVKTHQQRIDNEPVQLIAHNSYDEIGQITDKKVGGEPFKSGYTDIVKVTVNAAGVISKNDVSDTWNAGLATVGKLEANGGLSFIVPNQLGSFMRIGLSDVNTNPGIGELDFYYYFYKNSNNEPIVTSYARNLQSEAIITLSTRSYEANDTFAIEWVGGNIKYFQNGSVTDTFELVAPPSSLIGDLSFRSPNSMIRDLHFYAAGEIKKYLQDIDYKFNVRGWLTDINDVDGTAIDVRANDLFNFKINYNEEIVGNAGNPGNAIQLYNGNISQLIWKTKNTDPQKHSYGYKYDALGRILTAFSRKGNDLNTTGDHTLSGITYDKNGNILSLKRYGPGTSKNWDDLNYKYSGNKLLGVRDISTCICKNKGFNDSNNSDNDYQYDMNGNLTRDNNKYITNIEYNILGLPSYIFVTNNGTGGTVNYIYDAVGNKLEKTFIESGVNGQSVTTQYAGKYIYEKHQAYSVLQFIAHPEGYVVPTAILPAGGVTGFDTGTGQTTYSSYSYVFQYRDHLGNVRLSYSDTNKNGNIEFGDEIIEESNFYPFGIKHWGYNDYNTGVGNAVAQQYKFGGKQLQEELGLQFYDFGSRNYDAALGRWFNPDPQNQFASPYIAFGNNPIANVDPDGELAFGAIAVIAAVVIGGTVSAVNTANNGGDFFDSVGGFIKGGTISGFTAGVAAGAGALVGTIGTGTGFWVGTASGAASGFAGGATGTLINDGNIGEAGLSGLKGAIIGGAIGGISGGISAESEGREFWSGEEWNTIEVGSYGSNPFSNMYDDQNPWNLLEYPKGANVPHTYQGNFSSSLLSQNGCSYACKLMGDSYYGLSDPGGINTLWQNTAMSGVAFNKIPGLYQQAGYKTKIMFGAKALSQKGANFQITQQIQKQMHMNRLVQVQIRNSGGSHTAIINKVKYLSDYSKVRIQLMDPGVQNGFNEINKYRHIKGMFSFWR